MKRTTVNSLLVTELHDHQLETVWGARADAGAGGNRGADPTTVPGLLAPSNTDEYFGQLPSIPAHLNPPSYTPQIILEPVGGGGLY